MLNAVNFPYFGKPRNLRFDINAIADIEREMGIGISEIMKSERLGFDILRVMLWAGLKHEDQSLTPLKIGNHIQRYIIDNKSNLMEALNKFEESITQAMTASELFGIIDEEEEPKNSEAGEAKPKKSKKSTSALQTGLETPNQQPTEF
jgi:hypothetical protein